MNPFQLIGIALFACLIVTQVSRMIRRRSIPRSSLAWLSVWTAGIVSLFAPDEMTRIARALGVNRGADLLLYVSVLCGLLIAFVIYTRMRQTDRQITLIVRQLALSTAEIPVDFASAGGESFEEFGIDGAGYVEEAGDAFFGSTFGDEASSQVLKADLDER